MDHYFSNKTNVKSNKKTYKVIINNQKLTFNTDRNVFSKDYLDYGTKLLLESLLLDNNEGKVLDLGCGYGPIGIYVAKKTIKEVHMVDVNERALELTEENIHINKVKAKAYFSDIYSNINDKFNVIITNPPIRAGKEVVEKMLFNAKNYLEKDGELWLVVRKKQGAKTILEKLEKKYKVNVIKKDKGYYIIKAIVID